MCRAQFLYDVVGVDEWAGAYAFFDVCMRVLTHEYADLIKESQCAWIESLPPSCRLAERIHPEGKLLCHAIIYLA